MKNKSKKGAEMTIGTIVIIVLALVVLVVLIVGFTSGWSDLWGKITSLFGGSSNVANHVNACALACTSSSEYDYCVRLRNVKFDDKSESGKYNCAALAGRGFGLDACDEFDCAGKRFTETCKGKDGEWVAETPGCEGRIDYTNEIKDSKAGKKCCAEEQGPPETPAP